jgi:uncharacterized protein (TIGR03083 family)
MSTWDATTYEAKDNLLRVVNREAERFFALAAGADAWTRPTACPQWQVRDVVGHLIDVTEGYFGGFDAARSGTPVGDAMGLRVMAGTLDEGAKAHRDLSQDAALDRLRGDFHKMMELTGALGPTDWAGLTVPHKFMGPLPAYFYPVFQLMDYGVHSWDIRQGVGRAHALEGEAADLLVPFMFVLWQATADIPADAPATTVGVRICSGNNAGTWRVEGAPAGVSCARGDVDDLPLVLEFDPGSFILTAFGRSNAGTVRGDAQAADRFLNMFFRI